MPGAWVIRNDEIDFYSLDRSLTVVEIGARFPRRPRHLLTATEVEEANRLAPIIANEAHEQLPPELRNLILDYYPNLYRTRY
jgi:hypothetical protein